MKRLRFAWVAALLLAAEPGLAVPSPVPTGRLDYSLSWNGIPAGSATVEVARIEQGSAPHYRVEAMVKTSWLVDLLWSLRGRAASSFTADTLTPLGFEYDREVNRDHSVTDIVFDATTPEATGTLRHSGTTKSVAVQESGVVDPVTAVFRALSQPIHVGDTLRYEVFTGESRYRIELAIVGEDAVTVAAGTFWSWRVEPRVWKVGTGLEPRLRHATLWVSQSPLRTLLRIRSEVFIGAVNCDLQHVDAPGGALPQS